jgi:hypothetical protein
MKSPCSSESLPAGRTGYSVPRSLLGVRVSVALEVFRPAASPHKLARVRFILSRASASYRDPPRSPRFLWPGRSPTSGDEILPWSSSPLQRVSPGESACCPGSTRNAIPPRPFSDPRGFDPHRASRPCSMPHPLMGLLLPRAFPYRRPPASSSLADTLSMFLAPRSPLRPKPPRVCSMRRTLRALHPAAVRCSSSGCFTFQQPAALSSFSVRSYGSSFPLRGFSGSAPTSGHPNVSASSN